MQSARDGGGDGVREVDAGIALGGLRGVLFAPPSYPAVARA
jgi:hypothetical protein